jgi:hypothetical protein
MGGEGREQHTGARLRELLRPWGQRAFLLTKHAARQAGPALRAFWRAARPVLRAVFQVFLALVILLEEWGWRPLAALLGRLAKWRPWAQAEYAIARLPPYVALLVFMGPTLLLLPLKFLALLLVANGQFVMAAILFAAAKVVATALIARLFMLTQPALMQIGWFAWCYERFMPWKESLVENVRASWVWRVGRFWKERAKRVGVGQWRTWRPALLQLRSGLVAAAGRLGTQTRRLAEAIKQRWAARQS